MSAIAPSGPEAPANILIAEDSPTQLKRLQHILEKDGYRVTATANGRKALEAAQLAKPTLILTDVNMPEMNGYELCRHIKADARLADVPVIMVTTLTDPLEVIQGLECRADNFIVKPYREDGLRSCVQAALLEPGTPETGHAGEAVEIVFNRTTHRIDAGRKQILKLLLSTYEASLQRNVDLDRSQQELRAVNERLGDVNQRLEQQVRERVKAETELKRARLEAEQASRSKSTFLATMSHEIRTPMNGVIGMLEVLHQTSLKGNQVEMVNLIRESAFSLLGIIEDILDFSKIEAGKLELENVPMSPAGVVEKASGLMDNLARKNDVELALFIDPAIPGQVMGDALRLRQVVINLVSNAVKFSARSQGSGRVSVRVLLVKGGPDLATLQISVTDDGIGMDEATQARLFTSFTQADASTTRRFGGTGLGLAIVHHLVQLMGGEIAVQSAPGKGSTFRVRLPFALLRAEPESTGTDADVAELSCLVVGAAGGLADDLAAYLAHGRAKVEQVADLAGTRAWIDSRPPGLHVWIIDAEGEPPSASELRALTDVRPDLDIRFVVVVIARARDGQPRVAESGLITMDGNALKRRAFLRAVAIAAGRMQAEEREAASGEGAAPLVRPTRATALQQGRLILAAEDNETNQKVLDRQLGLLGYAVDIASDGREALERWRSGDYALLLTDLHMPEMDGYALTAAIRAAEQGAGRIPIIALTANALKGEEQVCREAGMDGYLSKPAKLADLKATLEEWMPAAAGAPPALAESPPSRAAAAPPVDVSVLEGLVGKDPEVIREFLQDFRASAASIAAELRAAGAAGDAQAAGAAAHKLKSSARSVGALALGELCAEIEQAAKAGQGATIAGVLPRFEAEMARVEKYLGSRSPRRA